MEFARSTFAVAVALFISIVVRSLKKTDKLSPPPGPKPVPVLGSLFALNRLHPWLTYTDWRAKYGDIIHVRIFNRDVIVLNSVKAARALLDQRSHNYSDRPRFLTLDLFGVAFRTVMLPYGNTWRLHRRLYHQAFRAEVAVRYRPMQVRRARQLLLDLQHKPDDYVEHLHWHSASIIMSAVYDYESKPSDPLVAAVTRTIEMISKVEAPSKAAMIEAYPLLTLLPEWFPGASFQRQGKFCRELIADVVEKPYEFVQKSIAAGTAAPSMVFDALKKLSQDGTGQLEKAIKESSATAFGAATETTFSTLVVFILAMVLNPAVQQNAQAELDSVVGAGRLPDFDDRTSLPYVEAVLRETLRWHPVVPLGIAHAALRDDIYEGYLIPKGATIIANVWGMSQDSTKYPNPSEFRPERFLLPDGSLTDDTMSFGFGWGRRICHGRHIADASLWSAIASMLSVFSFLKAQDAIGKDIEFEPQWTPGTASRPVKFPCRIVPRRAGMDAEKMAQLISVSG
ncbi:cytochrome P450 [Phlebopus sp. FC_14]|nr:cytochrome P450 [Phlebopus sp. FC_14]